MTTRERISNDLTAAVKGREASVVSTLRMLLSALKNADIEKGGALEEEEVIEVVGKEVKKLRDSIESFEKGGRQDLADSVRSEIELMSKYLPEPLTEDELRAVVSEKMSSMGDLSPQDFGRLMSEVMKEVKGRAEGGQVSALVKEALAGGK